MNNVLAVGRLRSICWKPRRIRDRASTCVESRSEASEMSQRLTVPLPLSDREESWSDNLEPAEEGRSKTPSWRARPSSCSSIPAMTSSNPARLVRRRMIGAQENSRPGAVAKCTNSRASADLPTPAGPWTTNARRALGPWRARQMAWMSGSLPTKFSGRVGSCMSMYADASAKMIPRPPRDPPSAPQRVSSVARSEPTCPYSMKQLASDETL
mmetsp:Transcript_6868/g.18477  ORF Transcript_6868/g.18477 Transcript_6868/m.18477 type:complete len:212 (+) Transcript_6868:493-1128(+)